MAKYMNSCFDLPDYTSRYKTLAFEHWNMFSNPLSFFGLLGIFSSPFTFSHYLLAYCVKQCQNAREIIIIL